MSVEVIAEDRQKDGIRPFVLKWAEKTPESLLWGHRSVFSARVNGLDVLQVFEAEHYETTGAGESADTSHT